MLSFRLAMRLSSALFVLVATVLTVAAGACVLNPQPQPPDDGANADAGPTLGNDGGVGDIDGGKGLDGGRDADAAESPDASDADAGDADAGDVDVGDGASDAPADGPLDAPSEGG